MAKAASTWRSGEIVRDRTSGSAPSSAASITNVPVGGWSHAQPCRAKPDAQSDSAAELGAALESLRSTHEEQTRQVQRQQTDLVLKQYELTAARERDKQLAQLHEQAVHDAAARAALEEAVARHGVQAELLTNLARSLEASVAGQISSHLATVSSHLATLALSRELIQHPHNGLHTIAALKGGIREVL